VYPGKSAFSEPETKNIAQFVAPLKPVLAAALHSYGGMLLYPYSHDQNDLPDNAEETVGTFASLSYNNRGAPSAAQSPARNGGQHLMMSLWGSHFRN
jgi:hypothetical protein